MKNLTLIFSLLISTGVVGQGTEGYEFPPYIIDPPTYGIDWSVDDLTWPWAAGNEVVHQGANTFEVHQDAQVEFRSANRIRISGPFRATDLTSTGRFHAHIQPDPFEVRLMTPTANGAVGRFEKVEFGIRPPQDILDAIDVFLDYNNLPYGTYQLDGWQALGGINPFLEWEIKVSGTFEILDPNNNWATISERTIDAFYFKDYHPTIARPLGANDPNNPTGVDESFVWDEKDTQYPFRLRVAPEKVGTMRCKFRLEVDGQPALETDYYLLDVVNTGEKGFVKVGQTGRFLVRDGETFFPIGRNLIGPHCKACEDNLPPYGYSAGGGGYLQATYAPEAYHLFLRDIQQVHDNGGRYFRMFSLASTLEIEFEHLGNYTDRLHIAHELDRIFDKVDELDMMLQWDLSSNSPFLFGADRETQWDWLENSQCGYQSFGSGDYIDHAYCYNSELGLAHPLNFLTSEDAFRYYEQRIRYIISRWGYSTKIAAISFMNEMDSYGTEATFSAAPDCQHTLRYEPYLAKYRDIVNKTEWFSGPEYGHAVGNWAKRLAEYVKHPDKLGHDQHLIYVDYKESFFQGMTAGGDGMQNQHGDDAISSPYIDIFSFHTYTFDPDRYLGFQYEIEQIHSKMLAHIGQYKPILLSETDNGVAPCDLAPGDRSIVHARTLLASAFTGAAGSGLPWNHVNDEWGEDVSARLARYEAWLRSFMEGINLDGEDWTAGRSARDDNDPNTTDDDHRAEALYFVRGDGLQATGLIHNRTYNHYTEAHLHGINGSCLEFGTALDATTGDFVNWPTTSEEFVFRTYENISFEIGTVNSLRVTGLSPGSFLQTYYYYGYVNQSLPNSPDYGPQNTFLLGSQGNLHLEYPTLQLPDAPFMLFRTQEQNSPFRINSSSGNVGSIGNSNGGRRISHYTENHAINGEAFDAERVNVGIYVYPNPVENDNFNIVLGDLSHGQWSYQLYNAMGQLLMQGFLTESINTISIGQFVKGLYIVKVVGVNKCQSFGIIRK